MNFTFKPKYTYLAYQVLIGETKDGKRYPYQRVGDIWMGVICKKICDYLGLYIYSGNPKVDHIRASNPFVNLKKEATAIEINEVFWQYIDRIDLSHEINVSDCYLKIAEHLVKRPLLENKDYWVMLGKAMKKWIGLVDERRKKQ